MNPETLMSYAITQAQRIPENAGIRRGLLIASGSTILAYGENLKIHASKTPLQLYVTLGIEPTHSFFKQVDTLFIDHVFTALPYPEESIHQSYHRYFAARHISVSYGIQSKNSFLLNKKWLTSTWKRRPYLLGKWAMTADGKIATRTGKSRWISGEASRHYVHQLRADYDAILVGIGTVLADDPLLTCRSGGKNPVRLLLDRHLRLPVTSQICQTARDVSTLLFCLNSASSEQRTILERLGIQVVPLEEVSVSAVGKFAFTQGIQSILIEGGGTVLASAFQEGILDEVQFLIAPKVFGGESARSPVEGRGVEDVLSAWKLENCSVRALGDDFLIQGYSLFFQRIQEFFQGMNIQEFKTDDSGTNLRDGD